MSVCVSVCVSMYVCPTDVTVRQALGTAVEFTLRKAGPPLRCGKGQAPEQGDRRGQSAVLPWELRHKLHAHTPQLPPWGGHTQAAVCVIPSRPPWSGLTWTSLHGPLPLCMVGLAEPAFPLVSMPCGEAHLGLVTSGDVTDVD